MQNIEGLWTFEVTSADGWGRAGVMVLRDGRILGGGDHYYGTGSYRFHSGRIEGALHLAHFHGPVLNVFRDTTPDFHLAFRGRLVADFIEGDLQQPDSAARLPLRLVWRAPLAGSPQRR